MREALGPQERHVKPVTQITVASLCSCGCPFLSTELRAPTSLCCMGTSWRSVSVAVTDKEKKSRPDPSAGLGSGERSKVLDVFLM